MLVIVPSGGIEARRQLVENQTLRIGDDRLGDAKPLLHSLGIISNERLAHSAQPDLVKQRGNAAAEFGAREALQAAV